MEEKNKKNKREWLGCLMILNVQIPFLIIVCEQVLDSHSVKEGLSMKEGRQKYNKSNLIRFNVEIKDFSTWFVPLGLKYYTIL